MEIVLFYLDVGRKLLLAVLAVFAVFAAWLVIATPIAVAWCRMIARADADMPALTEDSDIDVEVDR